MTTDDPEPNAFSQTRPAAGVLARAIFLGPRIDVRGIHTRFGWAGTPVVVNFEDRGMGFVFRFGVVVVVGVTPEEEADLIESILPFVSGPIPVAEVDETSVIVDDSRPDQIDDDGAIVLRSMDPGRLHVVGEVLAKSAVLSHFEQVVMGVFDRVEVFARDLSEGRSPNRSRALLQELGRALIIQTQTVGRVEVTEKPELTWDQPELDRLYERLSEEFELRLRDRALTRKLELISETTQTYLELIHSRQSIRVEWYIVILIVLEILIIVYELFMM